MKKHSLTCCFESVQHNCFFQDVLSQAQSKITDWKEKALSLTCVIPAQDAVMQECLGVLEHCIHHLGVLAKLQSAKLKRKHLRAVCEGLELCPALLSHQTSVVMARERMSSCRYWSAV